MNPLLFTLRKQVHPLNPRGLTMKAPLYIAASLAIVAVCHAEPNDAKHPLFPSVPRTVVVIDSEAPPVVRAGLLQSTLILLPAEEKVATVFGGDTSSWVFDGGHVASRFISIKPKIAGSSTDVHIVSDHGNEYTLQLREISNDSDSHFDSKVFVTPGDQAGKDKLAAMPVFVPAAELDRAKREAAEATAKEATERKAAETKAEAYRSQYPGQLHFDYTWDRKKAGELGLQEVWRDDKFTYLRGHFQETPVLYETKDGKGSLINWDYNDGLYTVPKTVLQGYLTIGKQRLDFRKEGN
ncbi:type IV secretion system protein VirB9 [Terriglobus roseus]|jgi:type IV secretory pathway VirB9-like protein|uniref:Type IV secretion system protein VirB9 n=2 Tax=Terriglobus TaxID=392733 RepID=A0A1H4W9G4_9BACT|nr:type IV secretion system protein VirB9 [Terriglobus roseus]